MSPHATGFAAENGKIAGLLREAADLLESQNANPFRVAAYRRAADTVAKFDGSVRDLHATRGRVGLDALPGIGPGIAAAIAEILESGDWAQLERLRGGVDPAQLFRVVPGIGPELARRIHDTLGVDTLEALEIAAHDGRLEKVPGIGGRRLVALRASLADLLRARPRGERGATSASAPDVATLLDVDREYRESAGAGTLPTIAPRRFNPEGAAWLPVLHTARGDWHFTALYSNTARAHDLGRTRDWVVLYFYDDDHAERQCTVVTESRGSLAGRRVVRGRELECRAHYASPRSGNAR
jgi:hypothetical protein